MHPTDFLFQLVSDLTFGMVTDIKTAMLGVLTLLIIMMGLDFLKDVLLGALHNRQKAKDYDDIVQSGAMVGKTNDEVDAELYGSAYKSKISNFNKKYK